MTQNSAKSAIASTIIMYFGVAAFAGGFLIPMLYTRLHFMFGVALGILFGAPFFVLALRLNPEPTATAPNKPFWPNRREFHSVMWGLVGILTLAVCMFGPIALFIAIGLVMPAGDTWDVALMRITAVAVAAFAWLKWFGYARTTIPEWFRGKLSDKTLDHFTKPEEVVKPNTAWEAMRANWQLGAIAIVAFCIAFGVIDLNNPALNANGVPKKGRAIVQLLVWCRGNPNTVLSSAWLAGIASSGSYLYQIFTASRQAWGAKARL